MKLPAGVLALGFVSLFMDLSSEMIHALLPLYLTTSLGASALVVGLIEGIGEATAQIIKLFSGAWSDRSRRRKPLTVLGYGLSAATKPLFALAGSPMLILGARVADRVGKGIRGAPRDALVADLVPREQRGAAYGLRQSLDTVGAVAGPLVAMALMLAYNDVALVFALAILPALASVAVLVVFVREPEPKLHETAPPKLTLAALGALGPEVWRAVALGAVLTLARISDAFLILRAGEAGLTLAFAPLVLVAMNLVYSISAWPFGMLSDRIGVRGLLILGFCALVVADLILGFAGSLGMVMAGVALWGLHMGLTQGLLAKLVAEAAPEAQRGTAFGLFNLVSGLALLVGNAVAGAVWASFGATACFTLGALVAALGLVGLLRRG